MSLVEAEDLQERESAAKFAVLRQKLELDFSFAPKEVKGKTTIEIQPHVPDLGSVQLNCRQIEPTSIRVEGRATPYHYSNLYARLHLYPTTGIYQYHYPKNRLDRHKAGLEDELEVTIPDIVRARETRPDVSATHDAMIAGETTAGVTGAGAILYPTITIDIEYTLKSFRDALHFVGIDEGDARYPHVYTRNSLFPGTASCLFPCVDHDETKCQFELSIRYPRTLGDAFSTGRATEDEEDIDEFHNDFTEQEKAMEMSAICSGEMTDDIVDPTDPTRKTASFTCAVPILPRHVGIAIGPFEHVDLAEFRDTQDDERLGSSAIRVHAFCLPGKGDEVKNSAMVLARALDSFTERYISYPFEKAYKVAFVDDLERDTAHAASLSICSSRLLFPEDILDPLEQTTAALIHAVASQWIGVNVIPQRPSDYWIILGGSWFMAEFYLRELFGRNEYRLRQKARVDEILLTDVRRPSVFDLGNYLFLDPGEAEFMQRKSITVLSILHNRLVKQSGRNGVDRCFYRLLFNARNEKLGPNAAISTDGFLEICEKVGHQKLDGFFNQWVYGSGCPTFEVQPSFNKKKQVVQLTIKQTQADSTLRPEGRPLTASSFMREAKEYKHNFRSSTENPVFVGPMTIRIHEADGTPYEHIVDINSSSVKVEIPYNTKYKRLKRNRRQKEQAAAAQGLEAGGDAQEEVTLYCLGDLFNTPAEIAEWRISDWDEEIVKKMEEESYEWIRIDADFEWIARVNIIEMPSYMYVSQLQQDKDVAAQAQSIEFLATKQGHPIMSSILVKVLMDPRYFYGIRTLAAEVLANSAKEDIGWIGLFHLQKAFREMFCVPDSPEGMTRPNNFSDRAAYKIQCAIPWAIASIRGRDGKAPLAVKRFLLDTIRWNDNRGNEYSDSYYMATLMKALARSLGTSTSAMENQDPTFDLDNEAEEFDFAKQALDELSRYQRRDEYIPSYHNLSTVTALECAGMLMKNGVIPLKATDFLQFTRIGNADNVRVYAWECLVMLGALRNDHVLRYMIREISTDPSPFYRSELLRKFSLALGQVALGQISVVDKPAETLKGGLVIEQETGPSERQAELQRKTLEGAMAALKAELAEHVALRRAMEDALRSQTTSARDFDELAETCRLIYPEDDELHITLYYPKYWNVEHQGHGRLRFFKTAKIRTKPSQPSVKEKAPKLQVKLKPPKTGVPTASPTWPLATNSTGEPQPVSLDRRISTIEAGPTPAPAPEPKIARTPTPPSVAAPIPVSAQVPEPAPVPVPAPPVPATVPDVVMTDTEPEQVPPPAPKQLPKQTPKPTPKPFPVAKPTIKIKSVPVTKPGLASKPAAIASPSTSVLAAPAPPVPSVPKARAPKTKRPGYSLVVKLNLPPETLLRFATPASPSSVKTAGKKRKADEEASSASTRPLKRQQSGESVGGNAGGRPSKIVTLRVGRKNLERLGY